MVPMVRVTVLQISLTKKIISIICNSLFCCRCFFRGCFLCRCFLRWCFFYRSFLRWCFFRCWCCFFCWSCRFFCWSCRFFGRCCRLFSRSFFSRCCFLCWRRFFRWSCFFRWSFFGGCSLREKVKIKRISKKKVRTTELHILLTSITVNVGAK